MATLAYYNAICEVYPGVVDLALPEEDCKQSFSDAIPIPARKKIQALFSGCMHRYKSFVKEYLRKHHDEYSYAVLNGGFYFGDSIREFKEKGIKVIMIHHNFEKEYAITNKTIFSFFGHWPYFVVLNERRAYKNSDVNCFLTNNDKTAFLKEYGETDTPCFLLGVFDSHRIKHTPTKENSSNKWVITGTLSDFQTYNSIRIFKDKYYPYLLKLLPNHYLTIAGRNPGEQILSFQQQYGSNVIVVPNPENMDLVLNSNAIFLCPTCSGSGQKLRIMDGLRKGMPILVHEVSSRGYEMFFNTPYFRVYNDIESFVQGVHSIVTAMQSNTDYKEQIIDMYNNYMSYDSGVKRMRQVLNSIL